MCFHISNKVSEQKVRTAGRNIVCYKVGWVRGSMRLRTKEFESYFRHFNYWFNLEYGNKKTVLEIRHSSDGYKKETIDHGFHCFTDKKIAIQEANGIRQVVRCYIPKGAKYYINSSYSEYVSNKIIIKSQVK